MSTIQAKRKCFKVAYQGETKRISFTANYEQLCQATNKAFGQAIDTNKRASLKFFYLDDEQELISISAQADLDEALAFEDIASLKFIVALSANEAKAQLHSQLSDNQSLAESLNRSLVLQDPLLSQRSSTMRNPFFQRPREMSNDFEDLTQSVNQLNTERLPLHRPVVVHEMATGSDVATGFMADTGTDAVRLVPKIDTASLTTNVQMLDIASNTAPQSMAAASSQAEVNTVDQGCDGPAPRQTVNQGNSTVVVESNEVEILCQLLMPADSAEDSSGDVAETIPCLKCKGSQVNKKGLPCRKCNGTGKFAARGLAEFQEIIREEVGNYLEGTGRVRALFDEFIGTRQALQDSQEHSMFACDGCNVNPICGIRYMCSVCGNYDLCAKCEASGVHSQHPMLKIRKPSMAPARLICQYNNGESQSLNVASLEKMLQSTAAQVVQQPATQAKDQAAFKKAVKYGGRFVKESISDGHVVRPGASFVKSWTYRNGGETTWPEDVVFFQTSGDDVGFKTISLTKKVDPEEEYSWESSFKAPAKPGRYTAFFRMQTSQNVRFGHKVWLDIRVLEEGSEPKAEAKVEPKVEQNVEQVPEVKDENVIYPDLSTGVIEEPCSSLKDLVNPKQIYQAKVASLEAEAVKADMQTLYEFGFVNFEENYQLMQINDLNLEQVAGILSERLLNKSVLI